MAERPATSFPRPSTLVGDDDGDEDDGEDGDDDCDEDGDKYEGKVDHQGFLLWTILMWS